MLRLGSRLGGMYVETWSGKLTMLKVLAIRVCINTRSKDKMYCTGTLKLKSGMWIIHGYTRRRSNVRIPDREKALVQNYQERHSTLGESLILKIKLKSFIRR